MKKSDAVVFLTGGVGDQVCASGAINAFYKKTGVPLLLNTSFNLAGFPIVEKPQDITYLHIPFKDIYIPQ